MNIYISTLELTGSKFIAENKLPKFREKTQNRILDGEDLLENEKYLYGYQTGDRFLPYLIQDLYTRDRKPVSLKSIVMENDDVKATFLPEFGMRLYSLYSKKQQRELLYVNPVMQIANLAIRHAWFSGGIEWNVGQLGHTFTTCESVFVAVCKDETGTEFLRMYEYERCKELYRNIDFYLHGEHLAAYVRMINPKDEKIPSYWWTNIAVPEEKQVRIFSGTQEVIYIKPSSNESQNATKGMGHGQLPNLASLPGRDASYPENFDYASEYFFQNEKTPDQTWEAAVYNDNTVFYERSSTFLPYRKMFCWGKHRGGKRWQDFLSCEDSADYVEIQAGLAPTQVHGIIMDEKAVWDFVQIFGGTSLDYGQVNGEWNAGRQKVFEKIDTELPGETIEILLEKYRKNAKNPPIRMLHSGNGFGAIEEIRSPGSTPEGLIFPQASIGEKELMWLNLLRHKQINDIDIFDFPKSYMIDMRYENLLLEACDKNSYTACNLLGIMYLENGFDDKAKEYFKKSVSILPNPLAYRNLYIVEKENDKEQALIYFNKAIELLEDNVTREYAEEYIDALNERKLFSKAWDFYATLKDDVKESQRVLLKMLEPAVESENLDFLKAQYRKEFATVREGERGLTEYYFAYQALCEAKEKGIPFTKELTEKYVAKNDVPYEFDFRLAQI